MNADVLGLYVCPSCHQRLSLNAGSLVCAHCQGLYPLVRGIPDFVMTNPADTANPFLHGFGKFLAPIYEGPVWFSLMLRLLGGPHAPTLKELVQRVKQKLAPVEGLILDFATGTGTYGRHVATDRRIVYGIDLSPEMLAKGRCYTERAGVTNLHFARADGEMLPFGEAVFDGCLFCGSLHIFTGTAKVLAEVGRTLKPGEPVVLTTVIHGRQGILKIKNGHKPVLKSMKVFELDELANELELAGFSDFEFEPFGCLLLLTMRKT